MIDDRELFERASLRFDPPEGGLERLLRRRDRKRRNQRIGAGALAIILALVSFVALTRAFNTERPAAESPTPTDTALRRNGEVIKSTGDRPLARDLVAQDPVTGEVRTLVDAHDVTDRIGSAAWSADGRWVAFEILRCSPQNPAAGLWVKNAGGESRQLMKCGAEAQFNGGVWAWSLVGAQLVVELPSADGDALVLIDPVTGDRTDLGEAVGDVTSLTWSPDGTRIAYATLPRSGSSILRRGSVYSVGVDGGEHSLLASSVGYVYGIGSNIKWSPDGAHILIAASEVYLMNADGSDLRPVVEGGDVWGMSWSPDGTRFAYATFSGGREERQLQIWTQRPDGSAPSLLFESAPAPFKGGGSPVWSPDGTQIAFSEYTTRWKEAVWLVANADGTGDAREIDELRYLSWGGGSYFCQCYG
jgi:Tol biopolymer transport system component